MDEWKPDSHWDDHPVHTPEDWRIMVGDDDTRLGYVEWVNAMIVLVSEDADGATDPSES